MQPLSKIALEYLEHGYTRLGWSKNTVGGYRSHYNCFCSWLSDRNGKAATADFTSEALQEYDVHNKRQKHSERSRQTRLYSLRSLAKHLHELGMIDEAELVKIERLKVRVSEQPLRRFISEEQVRAMFAVAGRLCGPTRRDPAWKGAQQKAVLAVLAYGGLRRFECIQLEVADVSLGDRPILRVKHGKRGKSRSVPIGQEAADLLRAWLAVRKSTTARLFDHQPETFLHEFSTTRLNGIISRTAHAAGLDPSLITAHSFRRFAATNILQQPGGSILHARTLLGHSSIAQTEEYIGTVENSLAAVVAHVRLQPTAPVTTIDRPGATKQVRTVRRASSAWQGR